MHQRIIENVTQRIDLTEEEQNLFVGQLQTKNIRRRQYLLQEGDVCRNQYFINKGCLRTYQVDEKGIEHVIQFAPENWWTGDMYSFLTQTPARYNIDAIEDTEVFFMDRAHWENLFISIPKFERFFRLLLQGAFISMEDRIIASMSQAAEERYKNFLQKFPQLENRVPQHQVASYLGITPESLSRVRKQLTQRK